MNVKRDPQRFFSQHERTVLYLVADGHCEICGRPVDHSFHADHIQRWADGGPTDVLNGRCLCPECNLNRNKKGITYE